MFNPGFCPTSVVSFTHPLVGGGVLREGTNVASNSNSSGGRKGQMSIFEDKDVETEPWSVRSFVLKHNHTH